MTFKENLDEMASLYEKKNKDYGNSFDGTLNEFGIVAGVIRMNDKMNRLKRLVNNKAEISDESIADTLIDLANYAVMTLTWYQNDLSRNQ